MGREKNAKGDVKRIAASQERVGVEQEDFYGFLKQQGIEDRALQKEIYEKIGPFAETLMATYRPSDYEGLERPSRPDQSEFYTRAYKNELAGIQDLQNSSMSDAADFYRSQGLQRTGVQGRGYGAVRAGADAERTGAGTRLSDNLAREEIYGFEDSLGSYRDALAKRGQDVNLSLAGANVLSGQQNTFNPHVSFSGASANLNAAGNTYGAAADTRQQAAQMPSRWARVGGALRTAASIGADLYAPGSGAFIRKR